MRKLESRNEKAKFLKSLHTVKSLHTGKARIADLLPVRIEVCNIMDQGKDPILF
jgi:hypothetical protein